MFRIDRRSTPKVDRRSIWSTIKCALKNRPLVSNCCGCILIWYSVIKLSLVWNLWILMSFLSSLIPKLPKDMNTNYSSQDALAISVLTFLVSVSLIYGIAYRLQLTFHNCLRSSIRYKTSISQHPLGVVSFVLCFLSLCFIIRFMDSCHCPPGLSVQPTYCVWCVVSSCWQIKNTYIQHDSMTCLKKRLCTFSLVLQVNETQFVCGRLRSLTAVSTIA